RVGLMMQRDELFAWRTVLENVLLGPEILQARGRRASVGRALELIEFAGLAEFANHYPSALSGGMRQRVAFLRTLMLDRSTVLLDEPFGSLDAITRAEMQEWLLRLWSEFGLTLLLVTHDVDEAIFMSERVLVQVGRPAAGGAQTTWRQGWLMLHGGGQTTKAFVLGFLLAAAVGVALATLIVSLPRIGRGIYPLVVASQTVPVIAIAPLLIIWLGFGIW